MTIGVPEILSVVFFIITALFALTYFRGGNTPKSLLVDWDAIHDPGVQDFIKHKQKVEAVKRYRELSRRSLKEANDAIAYLIDHPNAVIEKTKGAYYSASDGQASSTRDMRAALDDPQILDLMRQNKKIEAIKRYREITGVGLKEAKDAVEVMERSIASGQPVTPMSATASPQAPAKTGAVDEPRILDLLRQGKKIDAIKAYREMTGAGLKEAKDTVEAMERGMMF